MKHLLAIEDDPGFAMLLRTVLEPLGWRVTVAGLMADALDALRYRDGQFDALLVDLALPDSGVEQTLAMLPALRQRAPGAVVVVCTGYLAPENTPGADAVFEKGSEGIVPKLMAALGAA